MSGDLNRFKVFLPLPIAVELNNLLAYKGKCTYDGNKPPDNEPWVLMKYRESEDLDNPDNFWQQQDMITYFSTGIRRAVSKQADEMKWVRAIGVSRLANAPDVLSTE
eukprot:6996763-Heterocapsa_arctica.AAC.1